MPLMSDPTKITAKEKLLKVHKAYSGHGSMTECGNFIYVKSKMKRRGWAGVTCKSCLRVKAAREQNRPTKIRR